jgi:DNA-binding Lrp family transcriptional regulator/YHS domain-containing protein
MRGLDDTDREILRLLLENGRKPYREIASAVDLSAPAVSDRVERLEDLGLIRRFTVDLDRSLLDEGQPIMVRIDCEPGAGPRVQEQLASLDVVEHVFRTADDTLLCTAVLGDREVGGLLSEAVPLDVVLSYDVSLLVDSAWQPSVGQGELALECVECGNTVNSEGTQEEIDGTLYHFCCASCQEKFLDRYEQLSEGA